MTTTLTGLTAKIAHDTLTDAGVPFDAATRALVRAEKFGTAPAGGLVIAHTGYVRNAGEFHAGTSVYRITTS